MLFLRFLDMSDDSIISINHLISKICSLVRVGFSAPAFRIVLICQLCFSARAFARSIPLRTSASIFWMFRSQPRCTIVRSTPAEPSCANACRSCLQEARRRAVRVLIVSRVQHDHMERVFLRQLDRLDAVVSGRDHVQCRHLLKLRTTPGA